MDLGGEKNTTRILQDLGRAFPFPSTDAERDVMHLLGDFNRGLTERAIEAMRLGDAETLGRLMVEAQAEFDRCAMPVCPSQLTSPLLHALLAHEPLQRHVWGGKGIGSQGDGTAQLLCRSGDDVDAVIAVRGCTRGTGTLSHVWVSGASWAEWCECRENESVGRAGTGTWLCWRLLRPLYSIVTARAPCGSLSQSAVRARVCVTCWSCQLLSHLPHVMRTTSIACR